MKPAHYSFLFDGRTGKHRLDELAHLREYVESRPETSAALATRPKFDAGAKRTTGAFLDWTGDSWQQEMMHFVGSWKIPEWWTIREKTNRRWVNPGYAHARELSDMYWQCDCGRLVGRSSRNEAENAWHTEGHDDSCNVWYRALARVELMKKRGSAIVKAGTYYVPLSVASSRFGVHQQQVRNICQRMNLTWSGLREVGRLRHGATFYRLNHGWGVPYSTLADAFGFTKGTVYNFICKYQAVHPELENGSETIEPNYGNLGLA